jgi:hypothetical protein
VNFSGRRRDPSAKKAESRNVKKKRARGAESGIRGLGRRDRMAAADAPRRRNAENSRWLTWSPRTLASGANGSNGRSSIKAASGTTGFN